MNKERLELINLICTINSDKVIRRLKIIVKDYLKKENDAKK